MNFIIKMCTVLSSIFGTLGVTPRLVQSGKNLNCKKQFFFPQIAQYTHSRLGVKQGDALPSGLSSHAVNKCAFQGPVKYHIFHIFVLFDGGFAV